jgi:broad specificity phosphatase PhoE
MQLYLITHAHTEQLPEMAADAWRLSARGVEQAQALAAAPFWAGVNHIVVSSEPKTWLSVAEVVATRGLPVWIDSRLDELRRSGWSEDYAAQVKAAFDAPSQSSSGWETVDSVQARALAALEDLYNRFSGETLAVVGHGLCLSVARASILGQSNVDFSAWQRLSFASTCAISLHPPALISDFELDHAPVR